MSSTLKFIGNPNLLQGSFRYVKIWAMCTSFNASTALISRITLFYPPGTHNPIELLYKVTPKSLGQVVRTR